MRESELHRRIAQRSLGMERSFDAVELGPGDDCAIVRTAGALLVTVDQLVVGRHVEPGTPIERIGRKAIARSVSDIAAMAGTPVWAVATGLLPTDFAEADALFEAMADAANSLGCPLVGGDIATSPAAASESAPLSLTVTVAGAVHAVRGAVLRSGARPGDGVYVTGSIGNSLASGWHLDFEPRAAEAAQLAHTLGDRLSAMIDISDGLGRDAGRIAEASGVGIIIESSAIPLRDGASDPVEAAGDGEDYELLFTASGDVPAVCSGIDTTTETPITRIGRVVEGAGCVIEVGGKRIDACELGWDH